MRFKGNLDGLIKCLQTIRKHASGDTPVSINLWGDRQVALRSIYYDNEVEGEESIYLEGDLDDRAESLADFKLYVSTSMIKEKEGVVSW